MKNNNILTLAARRGDNNNLQIGSNKEEEITLEILFMAKN